MDEGRTGSIEMYFYREIWKAFCDGKQTDLVAIQISKEDVVAARLQGKISAATYAYLMRRFGTEN